MTGQRAFSKWTPFWGFTGIGLPISFAGQARPALMFLRPHELFFLYATEWLILAFFGLVASALFWLFSIALRNLPRSPREGAVYRVGFAMVIAVAIFFGVLAWVTTFRHSSPSLRPWLGLLVGSLLCAGLVAAFDLLGEELAAIAGLARSLTMFGAATLLSLPFVSAAGVPAKTFQSSREMASDRPNIVLITVDTLSASHLIPYASSRPTSPQIQELSARGTVFEQFHANSNFTTAGIASIFTGVLPWSHRVLQIQGKADSRLLPDSLPARIHDAGYSTAYFGSNPWAGGRFQGMSRYFDYKDSDLDWAFGPCFDRLSESIPYLCAAASNRLIGYSYSALEHAAGSLGIIRLEPHSDLQAMTERIARWCDTSKLERKPKFLWVHFFPPHDPYAAPKPWLGLFDASSDAIGPIDSHPRVHFEGKFESLAKLHTLQARYDESIAYVDHFIGQLLSTVSRDFGDNTAIILTADHGESFGHGYGSHGGVMLYEDLIHIPLIIAVPAAKPNRREDLASQIDIAPTIAALAGFAPSREWLGRSLLTKPLNEPPTVFAMNFEENSTRDALRTGSVVALTSNWKYVQFFGEPRYPEVPPLYSQLFDFRNDPGELNDVMAAHPDIASSLSRRIETQINTYGGAVTDR